MTALRRFRQLFVFSKSTPNFPTQNNMPIARAFSHSNFNILNSKINQPSCTTVSSKQARIKKTNSSAPLTDFRCFTNFPPINPPNSGGSVVFSSTKSEAARARSRPSRSLKLIPLWNNLCLCLPYLQRTGQPGIALVLLP